MDSLHVKSNITDSHLKKIESCQDSNTKCLSDVMSKMNNLEDRLVNMENKLSMLVDRAIPDSEEFVDSPFDTTPTVGRSVYDSENSNAVPIPHENNPIVPNTEVSKVTPDIKTNLPKSTPTNFSSNDLTQQNKCDYLILSDSMLKRIVPKRFTPRGVTTKRFIRGGASICSNFIEKHGSQFHPKNVIVHVGTRDLQNDGVNETDFVNLIKVCRERWSDSITYISLITGRKDLSHECVSQANQTIRLACEKARAQGAHVSIIDQFIPREDMFHDDIHLNNRGLAAMVKHLKLCVGLSSGNSDVKRTNVKRVNKHNQSVKSLSNAPPDVVRSVPPLVHYPFADGQGVKPNMLPTMQWQNPYTCMWPPFPMWPPMPPPQANGLVK